MEKSKAEKVFDSMMENDFCSQWLGTKLLSISAGECTLRMLVRKEMLNGFQTLHGGIAYALADSALAFASNSYGRISPLIQGSMSYAKPAKLGDELIAEAKVIHLGNKKADVDVCIREAKSKEAYFFFRGTVYRTEKEHLI